MAEKNTIAMFSVNDKGERIQVGWASPKDSSGIRSLEYLEGYDKNSLKDLSFEDDELSQKVAEEQHNSRLGDGSDGAEFKIQVNDNAADSKGAAPSGVTAPPVHEKKAETTSEVDDEPLAAEPVEDAPDAEKSAERVDDAPDEELADDPTDAQPLTRREFRETEENN